MAKMKIVDDLAKENLAGFFRRGARSRIPGYIPTGQFNLDFVLSYGESPDGLDLTSVEGYDPSKKLGLPLGKLVVLLGEEGSGKSSQAYRICGFAQKMGYDCVWIDTEHSFSDSLADVNGVNTDELIFSDLINEDNPDTVYTAEDVIDNMLKICKLNADADRDRKIGVIVLDSVANLIPKARMEAEAGAHTVGIIARLMSENLKKLVNYAAKYGVLLVFINQMREKIGVLFGNPETSPGGRALKHNASIVIRISKSKGDKKVTRPDGTEMVIGCTANAKIVKNRFAAPHRKDIPIMVYYKKYFKDIDDLIFAAAKQLQVIKGRKTLKWKEQNIEVENQKDFMDAVRFRGLFDVLLNELASQSSSQNVLLAPEIAQTIEERKKTGGKSEDKVKVEYVKNSDTDKKVEAEDAAEEDMWANDEDNIDSSESNEVIESAAEDDLEKPVTRKRTSKASTKS